MASMCYSCEYKEYSQGDRYPNANCPADCTVIVLLTGVNNTARGLVSLAQTLNQSLPEVEATVTSFQEAAPEVIGPEMEPGLDLPPMPKV